MNRTDLQDRVALVTGAGRGIGAAIAHELADRGAHVLVHYRRRAESAEAVCASIRDRGGSAQPMAFDLRDADATARGVRAAFDLRQRLDIVVNNAASLADAPALLLSEGDWQDVIDTNLSGAFRVCKAALRPMLRAKHGVIVNVASVAGIRASPTQANYSASKAGLLGLTRTLAREVAADGVRINAVVPGLIDAGMTEKANRTHIEPVMRNIACGRMGTAVEVARAVAFLASDDAAYIYGAALTVDGGLSL